MKKRSLVTTLLGSALALMWPITLPTAQAQTPVKVILDTDMDLDVDDAGALAVLHALADNGEAEILGVICDAPAQRNGNTRLGAASISAINNYYGRPGVPIGDLPVAEYINNPPNYSRYRGYANGFADPGDPASTQYTYYNEIIKANFPNANIASVFNGTALYRKLLASAPDGSVVIVGVGLLRVLNDLLYTGADGYSSLTGKQLVAKKVKRLVAMAGSGSFSDTWVYSSGFNWSFEGLGDAVRIADEWPTPIVVMPHGGSIQTGARLSTETPTSNPVRKAYEVFLERKGSNNRSSWDQLAVLAGVRGAGDIFTEKTGKNLEAAWRSSEFPSGDPLGMRWVTAVSTDKPDILLGRDYTTSDSALEVIIEDLMVQGPKPKYAGELEAESATLQGAFVAATQPGYSGTGFADYANTTGDYIEWRVSNATGKSQNSSLRFFYANGGGTDRPLKLTVNGTQIGSNLPFADTGGWATWKPQSASATLAAGTNAIRLTVTGVHGPNVDRLAYEMLQAGIYQAEDAFLSGVTYSQVNSGYTGSGYGNYNNINTDYIEWTIDKALASPINLKFRYANGYSTNRPLKITVNGTTVSSSLDFIPTGSWTTWVLTPGITANLVAGKNKVRLTATDVMGVNMDYLSFTSSPSSTSTSSTTSTSSASTTESSATGS